jgi:hypothetical protein
LEETKKQAVDWQKVNEYQGPIVVSVETRASDFVRNGQSAQSSPVSRYGSTLVEYAQAAAAGVVIGVGAAMCWELVAAYSGYVLASEMLVSAGVVELAGATLWYGAAHGSEIAQEVEPELAALAEAATGAAEGAGGLAARFIVAPSGAAVETGLSAAELLVPNGVTAAFHEQEHLIRVVHEGVVA